MKILFADRLPEFCADDLRAMGHEVEARPDLTTAELPNAIGDTQILVVRSTEVDAATIEAAPSLSFIIRAGAGTNTIDVATASSRGVFVSNVPGRNALAKGEFLVSLTIPPPTPTTTRFPNSAMPDYEGTVRSFRSFSAGL